MTISRYSKIKLLSIYCLLIAVSTINADVVINEVLARQLVNGANHDEFIELYNNGSTAVDIEAWVLDDREPNSISTFSFPAGSLMQPKDYFVVWIGSNIPANNAPDAAQQFYLGLNARLANNADDVLLEDNLGNPIDYVAWGSGGSADPPPTGITWNAVQQAYLDNTSTGQSISLTPNGVDSDTSVCWEQTAGTINPGSATCSGYLSTADRDATRIASPGASNNISADLSVSKTDASSTYTPGGNSTYVITISNAGPDEVVGASFTDVLPNGVVINGAITCTLIIGTFSCPATITPIGNTVNFLFDIAANSSFSISIPTEYDTDENNY